MRSTNRTLLGVLGACLCAMAVSARPHTIRAPGAPLSTPPRTIRAAGAPLSTPLEAQSHQVTVIRSLDYVANVDYPDGKDRLDLYIPEGVTNAPVIFSIHGGALWEGDRTEEVFVGERFAAAGYLTVVTSYRLSPQVSHPAHIQEVAAAFWVEKPGVAPDRPKAVWGSEPKVWMEASPARYLRADLPPVLLIYTDGDEDWRKKQNDDMAAALRSAGHKDVTVRQIKGRTHMSVWTNMLDGESEETSSSILLFAKRVLAENGK